MSSEFSHLSNDACHMKIGKTYQKLSKNNIYITLAVFMFDPHNTHIL